MTLRRRDAISTIKNRYVIRSNKKRKNCPQHLLTQHTHDRESDGISAVEILIAISHRYRRQPIFPWWSVEVRGKKREREKYSRRASQFRDCDSWSWKWAAASFPGRENESLGTTSIMAIPALAIPCVGQKGAQGQVENQCPFPLALLRVALSRCFGWDERYLLYDIKEGSGEIWEE